MTLSRKLIQDAVDAGVLSSMEVVPSSLPDEEITAVLDGRVYLDSKVAARPPQPGGSAGRAVRRPRAAHRYGGRGWALLRRSGMR
ncbi:MAG: hypothetical protein M3Y73_18515 [Actinomycetota bacterium]|nr:hypothetical protein [Actinomycetota bacterium]